MKDEFVRVPVRRSVREELWNEKTRRGRETTYSDVIMDLIENQKGDNR